MIIARADIYRQLYFINIGSKQGIAEGQAVLASSGVIIGRIKQVWPEVSTVLLLTDNNSRISAEVVGEATHTPFVLAGERGLTLSLQLVSPAIQLRSGMMVVTGGQDPRIPSGLPIGKIGSVEPQDREGLFQKIIVDPSVEARTLRLVAVLISELPIVP